jgi:hypothetical protein
VKKKEDKMIEYELPEDEIRSLRKNQQCWCSGNVIGTTHL